MQAHLPAQQSALTAQRLDDAIKRLRNRLRAESGMHSTGLTLTQVSVLLTVIQQGPVTAARLAALEHVTPQAVAQTLTVLKEAGLVRAEPDPQDGRKKLISADRSAIALIGTVQADRASYLTRAIDRLIAPEELGDLDKTIELLERLAAGEVDGPTR
ncbi:MarR family winged helix-turn-helix transcriptional regulator [Nocardia alni]|uniref:MarR family winged helix-turn-helix transcriptional regulator n=1 Tax=Nocardia alni TaxID=2815723 RepID=UPI001C24579A|nr:MarR family transcriptional regulator [Nocardia alni]